MPLGALLVRVKPSAQTVHVVAERGDLALLIPLQRGVLVRMPLGALLVRVKPSAQTVHVVAERGDLLALALLSLHLPPLQRCVF